MTDEAVIRVQPLGAPWETLGASRLRGYAPENIEASSDEWGNATLDFLLKAERGARRPDLQPFAPIELEIGGMRCWSGFVWQRPTEANGYSVGCRGWQFHLDDDEMERVYVHTRLSDYQDYRGLLSANLANATQAGTINVDGGVISLGFPNGAVLASGMFVGVTLDLGPDSTAIRAVISAESSFNFGSGLLYAMAHSDPNWETGVGRIDFLSGQATNAAPWTAASQAQTFASTIGAGRRYITVMLYITGAGPYTLGADVWVKIRSLGLFRDTAYESGNASILKADQVIKDALPLAPLLNQSTASISAGTFSLPEYSTRGYWTLRQLIESVNPYENYRTKLGGEDQKTVVFGPKPAAPVVEVGEWSGANFTDSSSSGEEILDKAIIDATGPDGARLVSKRTQTGTLVDRRGFHRSRVAPVNSAVTSAVADRFGDLYLLEHRLPGFAGRLTLSGNSARRVLSGNSVPAHEFLILAGEQIRLANQLDPNTGGWGRDGRIAGVTYRHNQRQVEIAIDDRRTSFEQILARYALLTGQA